MKIRGQEFLDASVGTSIRKLCAERVIFDLDAIRNNKKSAERHSTNFVQWCKTFWDAIYEARTLCPKYSFFLNPFQHFLISVPGKCVDSSHTFGTRLNSSLTPNQHPSSRGKLFRHSCSSAISAQPSWTLICMKFGQVSDILTSTLQAFPKSEPQEWLRSRWNVRSPRLPR